MRTLSVFYDYACPYCLHAHAFLRELLKEHADVRVAWLPIEAHPRPETYGPHSDLLCQTLFFARDAGIADMEPLHEALYRAALMDHAPIESVCAVCEAASPYLDPAALRDALQSGRYAAENTEANRFAYDDCGVYVLPAYRMDGRALDSAENIGVTRAQLSAFLRG